jgi:hypothetical protein
MVLHYVDSHLLTEKGCAMVSKCANSWCPTTRHPHEGKVFRLDIDLGNMAGGDERKTEYIWLCALCPRVMHPKVEVTGDTVTLRLTKNNPLPASTSAPFARVN